MSSNLNKSLIIYYIGFVGEHLPNLQYIVYIYTQTYIYIYIHISIQYNIMDDAKPDQIHTLKIL